MIWKIKYEKITWKPVLFKNIQTNSEIQSNLVTHDYKNWWILFWNYAQFRSRPGKVDFMSFFLSNIKIISCDTKIIIFLKFWMFSSIQKIYEYSSRHTHTCFFLHVDVCLFLEFLRFFHQIKQSLSEMNYEFILNKRPSDRESQTW